ncbi:hypothetical protein [Hamadaea tsunoensis]|uniref:hypothetical protein n=1 Tax=Hamadaea tsunoensis TaxID=53368 RepID=UPI0012F872FD|nr:hypothetical protein [Hamadaea tsunoensis]
MHVVKATPAMQPSATGAQPSVAPFIARLSRYARKPIAWLIALVVAVAATQVSQFLTHLAESHLLPAELADKFAAGEPISVAVSLDPGSSYDPTYWVSNGTDQADLEKTFMELSFVSRRQREIDIVNIAVISVRCQMPLSGTLNLFQHQGGVEAKLRLDLDLDDPHPVLRYPAGSEHAGEDFFNGPHAMRLVLNPRTSDIGYLQEVDIAAVAKRQYCRWQLRVDYAYATKPGSLQLPQAFATTGPAGP